MLSEAASTSVTRAAILWNELEGLYDQIDERMATGDWKLADEHARRLNEIQTALVPLVSALAAARTAVTAGPEIDRAWSVMAARGQTLAARRREVERRVVAARAAVQADIARVRRGRGHARRYGSTPAVNPRFTSRRI